MPPRAACAAKQPVWRRETGRPARQGAPFCTARRPPAQEAVAQAVAQGGTGRKTILHESGIRYIHPGMSPATRRDAIHRDPDGACVQKRHYSAGFLCPTRVNLAYPATPGNGAARRRESPPGRFHCFMAMKLRAGSSCRWLSSAPRRWVSPLPSPWSRGPRSRPLRRAP